MYHRRAEPAVHSFRYPIFFMFLDLEELPELFDGLRLWSARGPALAWFRREDHYVGSGDSLQEDIKDLVAQQTGTRPTGKVFLLTHLRYFGYCFNPISVYYCYDDRERLTELVLEVSNTPWGERHWYVLPQSTNRADYRERHSHRFAKQMHVSPFMPMEITYRLRANTPGERLSVGLSNWRHNQRLFKADLALNRRTMSPRLLTIMLLKFPFLTLRVTLAIHWHAFRLWIKKTPFFPHPDKQSATDLKEFQ